MDSSSVLLLDMLVHARGEVDMLSPDDPIPPPCELFIYS